MAGILIRNGNVVSGGEDPQPQDLLIDRGRIVAIGVSLPVADVREFDATGLIVSPGFIDLHVHLRQPGQEHKEDIASGTRAAMKGGFTTIVAMANTSPPVDSPQILRDILDVAASESQIDLLQMSTITKGLEGKTPVDFRAMLDSGAVGFSEDGRSVMDAAIMAEALRASADLGFLISDHCEDVRLAESGLSRLAEEVMVARELELARAIGGRLHLAHISTSRSVELIRSAKTRGVDVTAEVTPHHLTLTEEIIAEKGANAKMNPPLRGQDDLEALIEGLRDGTIDAIATDHAPHTPEEKSLPISEAPNGVIGLETCFPVLYSSLVETGRMSISELIDRLTRVPAGILGLKDRGELRPGMRADIVLIDIEKEETINPARFASKSRNTPFAGMKVKGIPVALFARGKHIDLGEV